MALGGVDMGRHMAAEAPSAMGITTWGPNTPPEANPMGIRIFAAAVLLIKLDKTVAV